MTPLDVATLTLTNTPTIICRVKRHLMTTSTHKHDLHAEQTLAETVLAHWYQQKQTGAQTLVKSSRNLSIDLVDRNFLTNHLL
jgi:hypothetical protein